MQYEENDKEELEDVDHSGDLKSIENIEDDIVQSYGDEEDYENVDVDNVDGKSKGRSTEHESLKARRALEERLASKKLRKELDYLYDNEFIENEEKKSES